MAWLIWLIGFLYAQIVILKWLWKCMPWRTLFDINISIPRHKAKSKKLFITSKRKQELHLDVAHAWGIYPVFCGFLHYVNNILKPKHSIMQVVDPSFQLLISIVPLCTRCGVFKDLFSQNSGKKSYNLYVFWYPT